MRPQVLDQRCFIEWLNAQAEVIDIAPLDTRCAATLTAEFALKVDQIDHRRPGAQMHQPQRFVEFDHFGPEHLTVEIDAALQIRDAQDDVINVLNYKRMHWADLNKL